MTPETPITDALWAHLSQHGWGREHLPCSTIMESHEKLELELATEQEQVAILRSDEKRLAEFAKTYRLRADEAEDKLAAWKEARRA